MVMDSSPERAEASLRSVERAGREALAEMRRLLGVLDGDADPRALAPQPGLADIDELLSRTRASGLAADLRVDGEAAAVSPALDLCAYRIVQEALTNVIKHAAPARAEVRVRWGQDALELEITDDGRGPGTANGASGGHGIAGMRERAGLHGGSIHAGAGPDGGFAVRARLPLAPELVT
jgi:signal transduction histidine kinase